MRRVVEIGADFYSSKRPAADEEQSQKSGYIFISKKKRICHQQKIVKN